jgi:hypothetical protein
MDNDIKAIARELGHGDIPDSVVRGVKQALAIEYISDILDGRRSLQLTETAVPPTGEDAADKR